MAATTDARLHLPFVWVANDSFGLSFGAWAQNTPLELEVVDEHDVVYWLAGSYTRVTSAGCGEGSLTSAGGAVVAFADCIKAQSDGFVVQRQVDVLVGSRERGFSTRFSLRPAAGWGARSAEVFMPGIWYRGSPSLAPSGSLAGDPDATHILVREDRLPLPLVMARSAESGAFAELVHVRPIGSSFAGEGGAPRIIDGRLLFGSLGIVRHGEQRALAFQFPGSEGDRTYIRHGAPLPRGAWRPPLGHAASLGWANRSHPLTPGFGSHRYTLRFSVSSASSSYDLALQTTWRRAFAEAAPKVPAVNDSAVRRASVDLLGVVGTTYSGTPSMPFRMDLAQGVVDDTSSQMGFVGKALPAAALLLRDSIERGDDATRAHAEAIVDFWAARCMSASGVPQTWYNIKPDGSTYIRSSSAYNGHLRIMSEGMAGMLAAYALVPKLGWLATAQRYGDFLVSVQNADGSLPMSWRLDGTPYDPTQLNASDMVIPFLVALYAATHHEAYRRAALAAGRFSAAYFAGTVYVGGACDNANVPDKEAAVLAMDAFFALHELTLDATWLQPAARAATYAETWVYAWNVPLYTTLAEVYPLQRTTLGVSLIALGQSGADNFMAIAVNKFRRLGALLGDRHFTAFGEFLHGATAQALHWDGRLGYTYPGLMNEAISLAPPRGGGVAKWLPWLTAAVLEGGGGGADGRTMIFGAESVSAKAMYAI